VSILPRDSVHHETIRLVSLSLRLRRRIARVDSICRGAEANCFPVAVNPFSTRLLRLDIRLREFINSSYGDVPTRACASTCERFRR
jgi:hypothetical protein